MRVQTDPNRHTRQERGGPKNLLQLLEDLRRRVILCLISVAAAFGICWLTADRLFKLVSRPIRNTGAELITLTPTEAFNVELKLALLASIFLAAPFIIAQVWLLISKMLSRRERRYALPFILSASLLFLLGGVFGYFVAFPFALQYLMDWTKNMDITARISAADYLGVFIMVELGLGVIFEIPALIFILSRIGLVSGPFLLRNTKYAVLVSFIIAAVVTPPDVMSQTMMAAPMVGLYLFGVVVAYAFGKKRRVDE